MKAFSDFIYSKNTNSVEIFVLEGTYTNEFGNFEEELILSCHKNKRTKQYRRSYS